MFFEVQFYNMVQLFRVNIIILAQDVYPTISTNTDAYISGDKIDISFDIGNFDKATKKDWVGLYPYGIVPNVAPTEWQYVCGGKEICDEPIESGIVSFSTPLTDGKWTAWYLWGDGSARRIKAWVTFAISGFS